MTKKQKNKAIIAKDDNQKPIVWTKDHEKILVDWGDKAMCYRWLHAKSHNRLNKINTYFTIPVIIMSTLTGTANFAADRVPENYRGYYSMIIGFINIVAGIITTIQQFLKISELNEAHRVSSISWDKFYRRIKVELAKSPNERQNVYDFLKACTEEFDRLMETSPTIQKKIIILFQETFDNDKLDPEKKAMFKSLKKPEICDSLESIRGSVYQEDIIEKRKINFKKLINDTVSTINNKSSEYANDMKMKVIEEFVNTFKTEMLRAPNKQEIIHNILSSDLQITEEMIDTFIQNNQALMTQTIDDTMNNIEDDIENGIKLNKF